MSYACYCVPPSSVSEALSRSKLVFAGEAILVREFEGAEMAVEFSVASVWKGSVGETKYLTTPRYEDSCGLTFVEGEEYLVYSENGSKVFLCSRTRPILEATADLSELGEGRHPPTSELSTSLQDVPAERTGGGCERGSAVDVTAMGLMAGLVWLGVRKRRTRNERQN